MKPYYAVFDGNRKVSSHYTMKEAINACSDGQHVRMWHDGYDKLHGGWIRVNRVEYRGGTAQ